ncbi:hypothetical protein [Micromonospora zhanjiangensis]
MRRVTRVAMLSVVAVLTGVTGPATAARAGFVNEPIYGDFNGDQFPDQAFLGSTSPNYCSVIVTYGAAPGVFSPPVVYIYLRPGGVGTNCPDVGTAFDFNADALDELWIGWSQPPPAGLTYNRIVLAPAANFQMVATFLSPITPVFLGTAVFVPGAIPTPYSYGKGGYATYIITPTFQGLGPERWCSVDTPAVHLRDFDLNGAQSALVSYTNGCTDAANGVVVVNEDGAVDQLQLDPTRKTAWSAKVVFANGDKLPDVQTTNLNTGQVDVFINTGSGTFVQAPKAVDDFAVITDSRRTAIDVLANDYVTSQATIRITTPPTQGTAQVTSSQTVIYTPAPTTPTTTDSSTRSPTTAGPAWPLSESGSRGDRPCGAS